MVQNIGGTEGSVLFVGPAGVLAQDNANFFWNDTNDSLGIRTNLPTTATTLDLADEPGAAKKPGLTFKRINTAIAENTALGTIDFAGTAVSGLGPDTATPRVGASIQGCVAQDWVNSSIMIPDRF